MNIRFLKFLGLSILLGVFVLANFQIFALTPQEERKLLEEELKKLEEQIVKYEADITKTQQEKRTLQNQISILKNKIQKLNLQIQESNVMIKDVGFQIKDTESSITTTSLKIEDSQEKLSQILQIIYEEDQKGILEILLSENSVSAFFENLLYLENLSSSSSQLLQDIKSLKIQLGNQKEALDTEKEDLERILKIQILQKKEGELTETEKKMLLEKTKGKEALYQQYLKESQKKAAEIRSRIFELIGVPEAPTFGEALDIAKYVERITGVRPALLLAVLTQESNIGKNVGQCYLKNPTTGDGARIRTGEPIPRVMKPSRDVQPFLQITQQLGRDPFNTPVSCPIPSVGGYGGAMGPAQFIPSTWILYKDRVSAITGRPADPWNISDAFLAAGLYLKDYGAASQNPNDEWRAAMIYFSGTTNTKYRFYGDSVMALASRYQQDIATLGKLAEAVLKSINNII